MSCVLKLNSIYNSLTQSDKKIADYILNNKKDILKMSVAELSSKCEVSTASVVRFSKKVGYDGFSDLKIELAKTEDNESTEEKYSYIDENSSLDYIINSVANKNANTIYELTKLNKEAEIKRAVDSIIDSKNVNLFAIGSSSLVAQDLQMKLIRINKNTITFVDSHMQVMSANNVGEDDVCIGISYSGESKEVLLAMKKAKENNATCISITKYGKSSLSDICDINLYVPMVEKSLREGAISSRIAMLTLIDIIYLAVMQRDFKENESRLIETRQSVKGLK